jgi:phosphocarrier protein
MRRFRSDAEVVSEGRRADARSVLELLALSARRGDEVEIVVRGVDARACANALVRILSDCGSTG